MPTASGCFPARRTATPRLRSRRSGTASQTGTPFLGTCGGFQHALVELARSRAGIANAAHEESDPDAVDPVVSRLACSLVGEVRLVTPMPGTRFAAICGDRAVRGLPLLQLRARSRLRGAARARRRRRRRDGSRRRSRGDRAAGASLLPRDGVPAAGRVPARAAGSGRCSRRSSQRQPRASSSAGACHAGGGLQ